MMSCLVGNDENDLRIFLGFDRQIWLVICADSVADLENPVVDAHNATRRRQIGVSKIVELVLDLRAGEQRGTEYACVRTDRQGANVSGEPACQHDELVCAICLWKAASVPVRLAPYAVGPQPNLEQPQWLLTQIVLGMPNACPGTNRLNVAGSS